MEHTRQAAVQILNDVGLCSEAQKKVEHLTQLAELLVHKERRLLAEFLPDMAQLQVDPSALVRKTYVGFLAKAADTDAGAAVVQQASTSITALLRDSSPMVVRAALAACSTVLRVALGLLGAQPSSPEALKGWEAARAMQAAAGGLLQASGIQDGVKLAAAKVVEGGVLLLSADHAPAPPGGAPANSPPARLPQAAALGSEATAQLRLLLDLMRPDAAHAKGKGPLLIAAVKAAAVIATARPSLLGRILPSLLTLAKEGGYRASESAGVGPDTPGTELSVGNALRSALCSVLRSRHPASVPWRDRLVEALGGMGAGQAAELSLKFVARQDYKDAKAHKHQRDGADPPSPDAKRVRTSSTCPLGPPGSQHPQHHAPHASRPPFSLPQHPPPYDPRSKAPPPHIPELGNPYGRVPGPRPPPGDPRRTATPPIPVPVPPGPLVPVPPHLLRPPQPTITLLPPVAVPPPQPPSQPPPPSVHSLLPLTLLPPPTAASTASGLARAGTPPPTHPLTSKEELMQLHMMLPALLAHPDASLVPAFLDSLCTSAPAMIADLVIALMLTSPLPSLEEVTERLAKANAAEAEAVAAEPGAKDAQGPGDGEGAKAAAGAAAAAVASHDRRRATPPPAPPPAPAGTDTGGTGAGGSVAHGLPSMAAMSALLKRPVGSGAALRRLPPGQAALQRMVAGPRAVQAQAALPAPAPPPAVAAAIASGAPLVPPAPLSASGMHMLRTAAVRRVAACGSSLAPGVHQLWAVLLSRLAAAGSVAATAATDPSLQSAQQPSAASEAAAEAATALHIDLLTAAEAEAAEGRGLELALDYLSALLAEQLVTDAKSRKAGGVQDEGYQEAQQAGDERSKADVKLDTKMSVERDVKPLKDELKDHKMEVDQETQPVMAGLEESQGQQGSGTAVPSASGGLQLSNTRYEAALIGLLERLRDGEHWSTLRSLLAEAPALTVPGCIELLQSLVVLAGDAASTALTSAREAILARPALREPMLKLVLKAAYDAEATTRSKAVRLCCNQLAVVLNGILAPSIIQAATDALQALLRPPTADMQDPEAGPSEEWTTAAATRYCELYATLCVRHHELLPGLMETFAAAPLPVRAALMSASESLAKALGHSNPQLVDLVRNPIPGSEPLVWHMLEVLMSCLLPSEAMLTACRQRAERTGDVSSLVPVVAALSKPEVIALLPRLLQVPGINLRSLYRKLATHNGALGEPLFSPAELLVALHALDPRRDQIPARLLIAAVDAALHAPDVFPQQAVAQAIKQMEDQPVLPLLYMRSVITALKATPKLRKFIAELLSRLISRQIWLDPGQWRGFLLLLEHTGRPYFHLMLQLPPSVLERVLGLGPEGADSKEPRLNADKAVQLAAWAGSPDNKTQVLSSVAALFDKVIQAHRTLQQAAEQRASDAAAALAAVVAGSGGSTGAAGAPAATEGDTPGAAAAAAPAGAEPGPEGAAVQGHESAFLAVQGEANTSKLVQGDGQAVQGRPQEDTDMKTEDDDDDDADDDGDGAAGGAEGEGADGGGQDGGAGIEGEGGGAGGDKREVDEFDLDFEALEEEEADEEGSGGETDEIMGQGDNIDDM